MDATAALRDVVGTTVAATKLPEGDRRENGEQDAFANLRLALVAVKKDETALEGFSTDDMVAVLECVQRRSLRKVRQAQAKECLSMLFGNFAWVRAAQSQADLLAELKELYKDNTEMLEKFDAPLHEVGKSPGVEIGREETERRRQSIAQAISKKEQMEQELRGGLNLMAGFNYEFPVDPLGNKMDHATSAFVMFCDGITKLDGFATKVDADDKVLAVLETFQSSDWEGVMSFLVTMHKCNSRKSQHGRSKFVVEKLSQHCPSFKQVAERGTWDCPDLVPSAPEPPPPPPPPDVPPPPPAPVAPPACTPVVVWIDFKKKSYEGSSLFNYGGILVMGFQDNDKIPESATPEEYLGAITESIRDPTKRLDVVICNKKHMAKIGEILGTCQAVGRQPPLFVVSTRDPSSLPAAPGGSTVIAVSDWRDAELNAKQEVIRRSS